VAEVSEDEGDSPDAARVAPSASFPLLYSKGVVLLLVFSLFFLPFVVVLCFCLGFLPCDCFCFRVGSMTNTLASREELAAGASMGRAGLDIPLHPPADVPPVWSAGPNLEAGTCKFSCPLNVRVALFSKPSLTCVVWFFSGYP
jgi:hypothetical protein